MNNWSCTSSLLAWHALVRHCRATEGWLRRDYQVRGWTSIQVTGNFTPVIYHLSLLWWLDFSFFYVNFAITRLQTQVSRHLLPMIDKNSPFFLWWWVGKGFLLGYLRWMRHGTTVRSKDRTMHQGTESPVNWHTMDMLLQLPDRCQIVRKILDGAIRSKYPMKLLGLEGGYL